MNSGVKNATDKHDNINVELDEDTSTFADNFSDSDSTLTDRMDLRDESDADGGVVSEPDSDTFSDLDVSTEEDADNKTDSDIFSDTDADSDFDCQVDNSGVTDDEYDAGPEETRTIVWRHVAFHIIRSLVHGQPKLDNSHAHYQCN